VKLNKKKKMKNKVQIILIILCLIFFNSVNITCEFKDSGNAKVEMILTAKVSPAIQTPYWFVHRFFHDEPADILRRILFLTNNSN
jgi:hypothetical protein